VAGFFRENVSGARFWGWFLGRHDGVLVRGGRAVVPGAA
jgi:hypothetical protein